MSRAFVNEDAEGPKPRYDLPERDDPDYDEAAAWALLDGARAGDTHSAEVATGYVWGEAKLRAYVQRILVRARQQRDDQLVQLSERFLG